MLRTLLIATTLIILASPAHACYTGSHDSKDLYQVFNQTFFEKSENDAFHSDIELLNSSYYVSDKNGDNWWGELDDQFRVELTYTGSRYQQSLGIVEDNRYHSLIDFESPSKGRYQKHDDALWTVQSEAGFMWADAAGNERWGTRIYSDADYNYMERDLFLAFYISDSRLLGHYWERYGSEGLEPVDELWLIAFDGADRLHGDFTDLVAIVSRPIKGGTPAPVPLPASVLLLACGCSGIFAWRRRSFQHGKPGP